MALITAAEARVYLTSIQGTGDDTAISTIIDRAEAVLARFLGYGDSMEDTTRTAYLDGALPYDADTIRLPVWPVVSITSIYDSPGRDYSAAYLVAPADYEIEDADAGLVRLLPTAAHSWSSARRAIKVTYVAGYSAAPADLKQAIGMYVRHLWGLRNTQGLTSTSGANAVGLMPETIPDAIKQIIAPFALPGVYL